MCSGASFGEACKNVFLLPGILHGCIQQIILRELYNADLNFEVVSLHNFLKNRDFICNSGRTNAKRPEAFWILSDASASLQEGGAKCSS
ncbi:unnamed protein product [Protopolystoma xenopodis]|uniref:Uncharacterized protein n=1 Tax=Protopolystoma xenopodis TaxID=117903 RepID=A0A3S5C475_9PLAT|nr:unnamed protein product [Protopolystoma xenopodis]